MSGFDPEARSKTYAVININRIVRLCKTVENFIQEESEGDIEEFLGNLNKVFLILREHLHADLDNLEYYINDPEDKSIVPQREIVENMYHTVQAKIEQCHTSLIYEEKARASFLEIPEDKPRNEVLECPISDV